MMKRGEARLAAAALLQVLRQSKTHSTHEWLDDLLWRALVHGVGEEEAESLKNDAVDWRDEVANTAERNYIVWLSTGALSNQRQADTQILRLCGEAVSQTGKAGSRVVASPLRAAMRSNLPDADVSTSLRGEREIRKWALQLLEDLDAGVFDDSDVRRKILLEAFGAGLLADVGEVDLDLLRVVLIESSRGGSSRGLVSRRTAREWAAQMLYQFDMAQTEHASGEVESFWELVIREEMGEAIAVCLKRLTSDWLVVAAPEKFRGFTESLVRGVLQNREEIDRRVAASAEHWDVNRMGRVELAIIRLAVFEMAIERDVPQVVCINEAVDLAKNFTPGESSGFVNGILDRIRRDLSSEEEMG